MAGRGPQSFKKRQKEQQRKEKQQEKAAKRAERKRQAQLGIKPDDGSELQVLDGPLPLADDDEWDGDAQSAED